MKRQRTEAALLEDIKAHVNASARLLGPTLLHGQKAGDAAAAAAARRARVRRSQQIFQGDAGLAVSLQKMREEAAAIGSELRSLEAAIATPLPGGEVVTSGGLRMSMGAARVRATALREERGRLEGAVETVSSHVPDVLSTIRQVPLPRSPPPHRRRHAAAATRHGAAANAHSWPHQPHDARHAAPPHLRRLPPPAPATRPPFPLPPTPPLACAAARGGRGPARRGGASARREADRRDRRR